MEGPTTKEHKRHEKVFVKAAVITLSDTRTIAMDDSGKLIRSMLEQEGHVVIRHVVIKDDRDILQEEVRTLLERAEVGLIITNGGTGIGQRDITIEAIRPSFEKEISAFGVLFTQMSHAEIGSAALLSRACAGIVRGKVVFCLPGSPKGVLLAMERIILPELQHVLHHVGVRG